MKRTIGYSIPKGKCFTPKLGYWNQLGSQNIAAGKDNVYIHLLPLNTTSGALVGASALQR